jgi:hypothetical protein
MKDKKMVMLLVLVACIWGTIGYKIIVQLSDDDSVPIMMKTTVKAVAEIKTEYKLSLAYVDPFLKKRTLSVEPKRTIFRFAKPVVAETPAVVVDWSVIKYAGLVFNNSRKVKMGSVKVNNNDYFVKEGDVVEGFVVSDINSDSIKMSFQTSSSYIKRAK